MDKFTVVKNGLVLTLDRKSQAGYFNIIIRNGKIFLIDHENKFNEKEFRLKNPEAEVINAENKLVMPGFFNSRLVSSYGLNGPIFDKCTYENMNSWHSLKLTEKFLSGIENTEVLKDLLKISYGRSIRNGEVFVNESSTAITKDFFDIHFTDSEWIRQYYNLTAYDYTILEDLRGQESFLSLGFRADEDINNYSLSSIKKSLSGYKLKVFIDAALSQKTFESTKKVFGKSFVSVLSEMDLISPGTIISNPINLNDQEIEILRQKKCMLLISPSDYVNLNYLKTDLDAIFESGLGIITGTGYTGIDMMSELKILSVLLRKDVLTYEEILRTAILNPSIVFGISNLTGSIERNKSADLILYDLDDARNTFTFPEINTENICEFIIKNLTAKDISDVVLKGEMMVKDRREVFSYIEDPAARSKTIADKLYSEGKYFEYREKYLMRGRVDKLSINYEEEEETAKEEIFVDMTETGEYVGEGEFTIVGTKEEEFEKPREKDKKFEKDKSVKLKEIKSLEDEMNLFDENEDEQELISPKTAARETTDEDELSPADTPEEAPSIEFRLKDEPEEIELTEKEVKQEEKPVAELKKPRLKFGFKEDE